MQQWVGRLSSKLNIIIFLFICSYLDSHCSQRSRSHHICHSLLLKTKKRINADSYAKVLVLYPKYRRAHTTSGIVKVKGTIWHSGWTCLGGENAVWGAAECVSDVAAAAVEAGRQFAQAPGPRPVFLWRVRSQEKGRQCPPGRAGPQHLPQAPHRAWRRTPRADRMGQRGRPGWGRGWELQGMQQLRRESRQGEQDRGRKTSFHVIVYALWLNIWEWKWCL